MNKKIIVLSILTVFMLVAISLVSAVNIEKTVEKKESPLFGIRTKRVININRENIKAWFIGNRIFFLPFQINRNNNQNIRDIIQGKCPGMTEAICTRYCTSWL